MSGWQLVGLIIIGVLAVVFVHDVTQRRHAVLRTFPVVGHLRYLLEKAGPELRQYIVADNDEERPFSRDQRRWIYATAKQENPNFGFGTDNDVDTVGHVTLRHAAFPVLAPIPPGAPVPCPKILGGWRNRPGAFRPASVVNISAMSFGSLSGSAVEAMNRGAALAGCLHNTGEGGLADHHLQGGDLVFQLGTGYFGCRDDEGGFSMDQLLETVGRGPVRAIEVKLSQGAKPGLGGLLPAAKVNKAIAAARGVPRGRDVASPNGHSAFGDVAGLVDFVEAVADATGLPVGIKSAVGQEQFWTELSRHMSDTGRGPDFITVDGGEGGTGAAPLVFSDHVALPFFQGLVVVHRALAAAGLHDQVVVIGSGKLGLPERAAGALNLGADMVSVGREAMLAAGCIQAQRCHTGHCPTGVATQSWWLERGLDPTSKGARVGNYIVGLRRELLKVAHACGTTHPALIGPDGLAVVGQGGAMVAAHQWFGVDPDHTHPPGRSAGLLQPDD